MNPPAPGGRTIQMVKPDYANFNRTYRIGTGTIITVPRNEDGQTLHQISLAIENGDIDASRVTRTDISKFLLRPVVHHQMRQVNPGNGHRPRHLAFSMNARTAALAANITSVARTQIQYFTLGGVETPNQFTDGVNELTRIIGAGGMDALHKLLRGTHNYAINVDRPLNRANATTSIGEAGRELRDALCLQFHVPATTLAQIDAYQQTIANQNQIIQDRDQTIQDRNTLIDSKDQTIASSTARIAEKDATIAELRETIRELEASQDDPHLVSPRGHGRAG